MSAYLTWLEARDLALAGTPVRRDGWPTGIILGGPYSGLMFPSWLEHRIGLWVGTDSNHALLRVCDPGIFGITEFYASDWTTDPVGTPRDVCQVDPPSRVFVPPGIGLEGEIGLSSIDLHADIGVSVPAGVYTISFYLEGVLVGTLEATDPGRYTITTAFDWSYYGAAGRVRAWIDVRSSLPLPAWTGHEEWAVTFANDWTAASTIWNAYSSGLLLCTINIDASSIAHSSYWGSATYPVTVSPGTFTLNGSTGILTTLARIDFWLGNYWIGGPVRRVTR